MELDDILRPPLLTDNLPGVGGRIKVQPEDFEVEEIPAYAPSGAGPFLYLWIEKRDMGAEYFVRQIANRLNIPPGEVGTAGLKDRRALTRQMVSVPEMDEGKLQDLDGDGIRVLQVSRHGNKLRAGHTHGNRFRILIRDVASSDHWPAIIERINDLGLPNYYGGQRFGKQCETLETGLALLRGQQRRTSPFLRKLALSAAQSALFNHYLARRMRDGLLRRVLPGDVLAKVPFGGMFRCDDVAADQPRFDAREVVSAGPIFGRKTFPASGEAELRETSTLEEFGFTRATFNGFGKLMQGTRRHNLVYVGDLRATLEPDGLRVQFQLPSGSYATMLLRELMKQADVADEEIDQL